MFRGTVNFRAIVKGNGLAFPSLEFIPDAPNVEKVEIEGPDGEMISVTVHLASVPVPVAGVLSAEAVTMATLNRIAFNHDVAIENAQYIGSQFSPLVPPEGTLAVAVDDSIEVHEVLRTILAVPIEQMKAELAQAAPPGENNYGLFRSARQSGSRVEEFMNLYHILLMLHNDNQSEVDAFIIREEPQVQMTQHPLRPAGTMETVYTRLRNEFAHRRAGVDLQNTKSEMVNQLQGLIGLTRRAISSNT